MTPEPTVTEPIVQEPDVLGFEDIKLGKAEVIKEGKDLSIVAIGKMVERAVEVSNLLEKENICLQLHYFI